MSDQRGGRGEHDGDSDRGGGGGAGEGDGAARERQDARTLAEWVSLSVSLAILAAVLGLIAYEHVTLGQQPPAFDVRAETESTREDTGGYFLTVRVRNTGATTAEDVKLEVMLTPAQGPPETAGAEIRFLAGGGAQRLTVVFQSDPRRGRVAARVVSFLEPG